MRTSVEDKARTAWAAVAVAVALLLVFCGTDFLPLQFPEHLRRVYA